MLTAGDFDSPSPVVEHNQLFRRINGRIQQGGDKPVTLGVALSMRFIQGVLDGLTVASCARLPEGGGVGRCVGHFKTDAVDGQPDDRGRRQTPDPLTLPAGLGQH
jgi:hypothetical protein